LNDAATIGGTLKLQRLNGAGKEALLATFSEQCGIDTALYVGNSGLNGRDRRRRSPARRRRRASPRGITATVLIRQRMPRSLIAASSGSIS
jgi:hypothetical protein